jgi:hypothetical protein
VLLRHTITQRINIRVAIIGSNIYNVRISESVISVIGKENFEQTSRKKYSSENFRFLRIDKKC